ncbi:DNA polymerase III subunit delta' [Lactococcus nasutitermitis]|uniref:DNA polymerase III subunit delta n=1 Tax=Lactococcus nasutitermitis TaxID=1652957 RepID=A0ABV9JB04_9LACT|nr:DNA polymerase III subunit delta' [Lactococcus nasutitermitis]
MKIDEIQSEIVAQFSRILEQDKLSHAYLLAGGFGGLELAIWLSQAIFCEHPVNGLPDESCRTCRLVASFDFADLHFVEPEGQTIKTAQIREVTTVFNESGYESSKKVVIIRSAEKMHPNAANALLKSIEEPTSESHIFLLTENENQILATIKSRTQIVHLPKNTRYLQDFLEKNGVLTTQAELLSQICTSTDEALKLAQSSWYVEGQKKLQQFVKLLQTNSDESFLYLSTLTENFDDKEKQQVAFNVLLQLLNQENLMKKIQKTFRAIKMWQSNVQFEACLDTIVLEMEK